MRTVTYRLADLDRVTIPLGFRGENEHTRIYFDCKKTFEEYPGAIPSLAVIPPQGDPYPAVVVRDGDLVYWDVLDSDVAYHGDGEGQLTFTQDSHVKKTYNFKTKTGKSIMPTGSAPSAIDDWLTRANTALAEIPATIEAAVDDALEEAKESGEFDGPPGPQGEKGDKGDKGDTGAKGDKGDTGAKGDKGDPGATGQPGAKGDKGDTGAQGPKGDKGDKGDTGSQGPKGDKGDKGDPGEAGDLIDDENISSEKTFSSEKISDLQKGKAPVILDTASGAIASFPDGADGLPVEHCVVSIDPVQDLHGQSNPYPAGGGKNLFDVDKIVPFNSNVAVSKNGGSFTVTNGNSYVASMFCDSTGHIYTFPVSDGKYAISISEATTVAIGVYGSTDGTNYSWLSNGIIGGNTYATFTVSGQTYIQFRASAPANGSATIKNFMFESGSTVTAWAPYSNICPISGWTGCNVAKAGKNLLVKPFVYRPLPSHLSDCFFARAGIYTFSFDTIGTATSWRFGLSMFDANGNALNDISYKPHASTNFVDSVMMWYYGMDIATKTFTFTLVTDCYIRVWFGSGNTSDSMEATKAQLELGSTATAYEPYAGQTYPISWQTEAGTVYGGTLDVTTGVLTVDRVKETKLWSQGAASGTATDIQRKAFYPSETADVSDKTKFKCNLAPVVSSYGIIGFLPYVGTQFYVTLPTETDGSTQIEMVYVLATPQTYQLDPVTITTLLGTNNIYADTGDVEVQYRADTRLFCDKNAPKVSDVRVNGTSVLADGVANVPMASSSTLGVIKIGNGLILNSSNQIQVDPAGDSQIKAGTVSSAFITPYRQEKSVFYGLAKAASDTTQSASSNAVGTYTDAAKKAIRKMLGINDWEFINSVTVAEDSLEVSINTDQNGQPFALKKLIARITAKPSTTGSNSSLYQKIYYKTSNGGDEVTAGLSAVSLQTSNRFAESTIEIIDNFMLGTIRVGSGAGNTSNVQSSSTPADNQPMREITGYALKQSSSTATLVPKDTVIQLYGIRV